MVAKILSFLFLVLKHVFVLPWQFKKFNFRLNRFLIKIKIMKLTVLLAFASILIFSCEFADSNSNTNSNSGSDSNSSSTTDTNSNSSSGSFSYDASSYIEIKKDPCFGFCPVYNMQIKGDGKAVYNGMKNVEKEGVWYRTFTYEETNALFKAFETVDYWSFQDEYTAQVTDLPTTWTTLKIGEKSKTIKDYYGAPKELKALEEVLSKIAEEEVDWKQEAELN